MDPRNMKILVGVDFSGAALRAMAEAVRLSRKTGATLEVVHVFPSTVAAPVDLADGKAGMAEVGDAERRLAELRAIAAADGAPSRAHLRLGDAASGLVDAIGEIKPDLVLLGSRGLGPLRRALLGSVSKTVWKKSAAPVVIVPPTSAPSRLEHPELPKEVAWSCARCGHIRAPEESALKCGGCGALPATWRWAPVYEGPVDTVEPSIGHGVAQAEDDDRSSPDSTTASLFNVSPPGGAATDVNPELRVRY